MQMNDNTKQCNSAAAGPAMNVNEAEISGRELAYGMGYADDAL